MSNATHVCCLCGKRGTDNDPITREHVPPKQFYPKSLRQGLNLWVVPTHRSCNTKYKVDEEYFYHVAYFLVAQINPTMGNIMFDDLERRIKKPPTPALLQSILRTGQTTTNGGMLLPPGVVGMSADKYRFQQVAIKIGRCLFYLDHKRAMPYENCRDIRFCEREEDVPELYALSWTQSKVNVNDLVPSEPGRLVLVTEPQAGQAVGTCRQVFDYRPAYLEDQQIHLYTLRFWEAFAFCMAFDDSDAKPGGYSGSTA